MVLTFSLVEKRKNIAILKMNYPKALNSLHPDLIKELVNNLKELDDDKNISVVILTGIGKAFSAGGDLGYLESLNDVVSAQKYIKDAGSIVETIMEMKKPVIAMVNGVAAGAGFNIVLACDLAFATEKARFGQSFVNISLIPDCGGTFLLPRIVGLKKAKELMFSGELIGAEEALKIGVINDYFPDELLEEKTLEVAEKMAKKAPIALGLIKSTLNRSFELSFKAALENEKNLQTICLQTADNKEGIAAFKEKREADFSGE